MAFNERRELFLGGISFVLVFCISFGYQWYRESHRTHVTISGDRKSIIHIDSLGSKRELLHVVNLPTKDTINPDHELYNQAFVDAKLSPKHDFVAFSVKSVPEWIGIYDIRNNEITDLDFVFDGNAGTVLWSPNNRFFAVEILPPSGYTVIEIYDTQTKKSIETPYDQIVPQQGLDMTKPQWSPDGNSLDIVLRDPSSFFSRGKHFTITLPNP